MNKLLSAIRVLLLLIVCFLNIYCIYIKHTNLVSLGNLIYLILFGIIILLTIKDFIKKNSINNNKVYIIISILCLLIMSYILYRTAFDNNLFFNLYPTGDDFGSTFSEFRMLYLAQNMIYFNVMLILLLIYRKINFNRKTNN